MGQKGSLANVHYRTMDCTSDARTGIYPSAGGVPDRRLEPQLAKSRFEPEVFDTSGTKQSASDAELWAIFACP
jgi:hypothetical protein